MFLEACLLRLLLHQKSRLRRGPKPKQIGTLDYCRICGSFVYGNSTGQFTVVIVSGWQDLPSDVSAFSLTSFEA